MGRRRVAVWSVVAAATAGVVVFRFWNPAAAELRALEGEEAALCQRIESLEAGLPTLDRGLPDSPAHAEYLRLVAVRKRIDAVEAAKGWR